MQLWARGDIPKAQKFRPHVPCACKHPGICRAADRESLPQLTAVADVIQGVALEPQVSPGTFLRLQVGRVCCHVCLAYRRLANPKCAVFAMLCRRDEEGAVLEFEWSFTRNALQLVTASGLAKKFLEAGVGSPFGDWTLRVQYLKVKNFGGTLLRWQKIGVDGLDELPVQPPPVPRHDPHAAPGAEDADLARRMQAGMDSLKGAHTFGQDDEEGGQGDQGDDDDEYENSDSQAGSFDESISCDTDEEEEAAEVGEAEEEEEPPPDDWSYWWLTRTNRQSRCACCRGAIAKGEFRAIYHPNPKNVADVRIWKDLFWRYFHLSRECLPVMEGLVRLNMEKLVTDAAYLPKSAKETQEQYRAAIAAAQDRLSTEYAAAMTR